VALQERVEQFSANGESVMWKKVLLLGASLTGLMFEEGSGCGSNHLLLYGGLGLGALFLLGVLKPPTTATT
jgi:hypothetical protein